MRGIGTAACAFAAVLTCAGPARAQPPTFSAGIDLVNIGVTVSDRAGRLVTGLTAEQFEIREDGVLQTIQWLAPGDPSLASVPLHIGLLIDVSQSMERDIAFTRTASIRLLRMLPEAASITIVDFDTEVRVTRYTPDDFPRVVERIRNRPVRGSTALYDAIGVYLDGAHDQAGRKVMLLYTDGGDTRSALGLSGLLNLLKASDVTVYVIGAPGPPVSSGRLPLRSVMQQIAETTGGQAFFPQAARDLDEVYGRVLAEIRAQYTVGYVSSNGRTDGAWRRVEIVVKRPDGSRLRVRARQGYYGKGGRG